MYPCSLRCHHHGKGERLRLPPRSHLIDGRSASELNTFTDNHSSSKAFNINLHIRRIGEGDIVDAYLLHRCLKRASHTAKKGTRLDFNYSLEWPVDYSETPYEYCCAFAR